MNLQNQTNIWDLGEWHQIQAKTILRERGLQQIVNTCNIYLSIWVLVFHNNLWVNGYRNMIDRTVGYGQEVRSDGWVQNGCLYKFWSLGPNTTTRESSGTA